MEDQLAVDDDVGSVAAAALHREDVPSSEGDDVAVLGEEEEAVGGQDAGEEGEAQGLVCGQEGCGPSKRGSILGRLLSASGLRPQLHARFVWTGDGGSILSLTDRGRQEIGRAGRCQICPAANVIR